MSPARRSGGPLWGQRVLGALGLSSLPGQVCGRGEAARDVLVAQGSGWQDIDGEIPIQMLIAGAIDSPTPPAPTFSTMW